MSELIEPISAWTRNTQVLLAIDDRGTMSTRNTPFDVGKMRQIISLNTVILQVKEVIMAK